MSDEERIARLTTPRVCQLTHRKLQEAERDVDLVTEELATLRRALRDAEQRWAEARHRRERLLALIEEKR